MEEWKEYCRWMSDDKPCTTEAVIMVSNFGNIKRLPYTKWCVPNNGYSYSKEYFYPMCTNRGKQRFENSERSKEFGKYLSVNFNGKAHSIHRLVAELFVPNPESNPQVNHIDGNRSNNRFDNLEWVTNQENMSHANSIGAFDKARENAKVIKDDDFIKCINAYFELHNTLDAGKVIGCSHETLRCFFARRLGNAEWVKLSDFMLKVTRYNTWKIGDVGINKEKKKYVLKRGKNKIGSFYSMDEAMNAKRNFIKGADNEFSINSVRYKEELISRYS